MSDRSTSVGAIALLVVAALGLLVAGYDFVSDLGDGGDATVETASAQVAPNEDSAPTTTEASSASNDQNASAAESDTGDRPGLTASTEPSEPTSDQVSPQARNLGGAASPLPVRGVSVIVLDGGTATPSGSSRSTASSTGSAANEQQAATTARPETTDATPAPTQPPTTASPRTTAEPAPPPPPPPPPPTTAAPPPPATTLSAADLSQLRACESGGNYQAYNPAGPYLGAYQFSQGTWNATASWAGRGDLVGADPRQIGAGSQDAMADALWRMSGPGQWPHCGRHLPPRP